MDNERTKVVDVIFARSANQVTKLRVTISAMAAGVGVSESVELISSVVEFIAELSSKSIITLISMLGSDIVLATFRSRRMGTTHIPLGFWEELDSTWP